MSHRRPVRSTAQVTALWLAVASTVAIAAVPATADGVVSRVSEQHRLSASGSLVLSGGPIASNRQAIREIVDLAGGPGHARIGIVTAGIVPPASADEAADDSLVNSVTEGRRYAALFERFGAATTYQLPLDVSASAEWAGDAYGADRIDDPGVLARVNHLTGFFFADGAVGSYVSVFQNCLAGVCSDQPVLAGIRQRLADGAVVAGEETGALVAQGSPLVLNGESWDAWAHGVQDDDAPFTPGMIVRDEGGFGFFNLGALDVNVSASGRQGRLVRTAMYGDKDYAFGVDDATALVVTNIDQPVPGISVVGDGGVHVFDLSQATFTTQWVRDVRWDWLRAGDTFDLKRGKATERQGSIPSPRPHHAADLSVSDVWSTHTPAAGRMTDLGVDFARSGKPKAVGVTSQPQPRFEVVLTDDGSGQVWQSKHGDPRHAFSDLLLSIKRA